MTDRQTQHISIKLKAGVIIQYQKKVLLIQELNNRTGKHALNIIKGTFEPWQDTNIMDTAVREAREEANARVQLRSLIGIYYLKDGADALMMFTFVADLLDPNVYTAQKDVQKRYRLDENITEVKFFTKNELTKLTAEDFVGIRGYLAIQDYLAGKHFPLELLRTLSPR